MREVLPDFARVLRQHGRQSAFELGVKRSITCKKAAAQKVDDKFQVLLARIQAFGERPRCAVQPQSCIPKQPGEAGQCALHRLGLRIALEKNYQVRSGVRKDFTPAVCSDRQHFRGFRTDRLDRCAIRLPDDGIGRLRQSAQNAGRAAGREKFILYPAPGVTRLQLLWNRFHSVPTPTNRLLQASSITQPARG